MPAPLPKDIDIEIASVEGHCVQAEAYQLRYPKACGERQMEHRSVANAQARRRVGSVEQCLVLLFAQVTRHPLSYAGHVHLRQGSNGRLQADWETGTIDFPAVIGLLKQTGYRGYVALEYEHDPWLDLVDVMTESINMRNAVQPLL